MGKAALIIVLGVIITTSMLLFNTEETAQETNRNQASRDEEVLAREVARTAYSMIMSKVAQQQAANPEISVAALVTAVGKIEGTYYDLAREMGIPVRSLQGEGQIRLASASAGEGVFRFASEEAAAEPEGGTYTAWIQSVSQGSAFMVYAVGRYGEAQHEISGPPEAASGLVPECTLTSGCNPEPECEATGTCVTEPPEVVVYPPTETPLETTTISTVEVEFIESMAGYCSAIYLQLLPPTGKSNNGHGNNVDGVDSSNPGNSKTGEDTNPLIDDEKKSVVKNGETIFIADAADLGQYELIFPSGHNRAAHTMAHYSKVIPAGYRVNFALAVDKNCNLQGKTDVLFDNHGFDYKRDALVSGIDKGDNLQEGSYAMIQQNPTRPGVWRIAFEDLVFDSEKLADVKANSYGDAQWVDRDPRKNKTRYSYGGNGWSAKDGRGYFKLKDYGNIPDFSDQVIEIRFKKLEVVAAAP